MAGPLRGRMRILQSALGLRRRLVAREGLLIQRHTDGSGRMLRRALARREGCRSWAAREWDQEAL